ncbi:LysR family transcriptional regulator [Pseudooceanicola nanhaiensis]|uniref:LysR family transcriptional regulator n=1 Tax=Pseudooceanicola nanhaiensis TaxID=375761 RepID=UPI001CD4CC8B|nr:LysR family transcriptional regulator [Pseudooceanicola nanhaiensis]MCA0919936.1 LysR family transcriptional regulator [Pseudooceanicola nanhaiensis]
MITPDWNLLRAFHATATHGSLSAGARALRLTQPTLSRQVQALEEALGVALFERIGKRLVLTETGRALLDHVGPMGDAAQAVALAASGRLQDMTGRVRISASDTVATFLMPALLETIRAAAPGLVLELWSQNSLSDLHGMEADIALRHAAPDRAGLSGRELRGSRARFYASRDWVLRHGVPASPADLLAGALIGFDDTGRLVAYLNGLGFRIAAEDFRLVSNSSLVVLEMVRRGMGVAPFLDEIVADDPQLLPLWPGVTIPVPLWLVSHEGLQASPRIKLVLDMLSEGLGAA